jgi:hypothetical protein
MTEPLRQLPPPTIDYYYHPEGGYYLELSDDQE